MAHKIYIGTSGWVYKHWRGTFYPDDLKTKDQFQYYVSHFDTVEINNSFYRLPDASTFESWKANTPPDFVYVIKASRFITHMKKLHDPIESSARFFERVVNLQEKIGAILFQLPPMLKRHVTLLDDFIAQMPRSFRYVFEFRNADWYHEEVYAVLRKYNCAFCIYELDGHLSPLETTADFVYLRLHGPGAKYQGSYSDQTLSKWAKCCTEWRKTKDVFVYFDNDEKGYAAFNALRLKQLAG